MHRLKRQVENRRYDRHQRTIRASHSPGLGHLKEYDIRTASGGADVEGYSQAPYHQHYPPVHLTPSPELSMMHEDGIYAGYIDAIRTSSEVVLQYDGKEKNLSTWYW